MSDSISLGKNGNIGKIDLNRIKAGVKKDDIAQKDARLESVFDMVDTNKNGVLEREEIDALKNQLGALAGDDNTLEKKEVKNFDGQKLGRKDRKAMLEFLKKLDGITPENVDHVETVAIDGKQVEVVTFTDGHTEEYYPDGKKVSNTVSDNKKIQTTEENGTLTSEIITENEGTENEIVSTTTINDGHKQTVIENKGDKTTTTINYDGDKKTNATVVGENSTSVITYDSEGNPAKEVETSGSTEKTYIYQNGQKVLQSVIENKGLEGKELTKTYDSEGGYTQVKNVPNGKIITVVDKDGNVTSNVKTEVVNGKELSLELDKDGNIPGVIVQNGESPAAIAKKFGCSVDELMELNAEQVKTNGKAKYFDVGAEIKLPGSVSVEKFMQATEGRKTAEETKADYAHDAQIRRQKAEAARQRAEASKEERAYYQKLGVKNFNNKGKKVKAVNCGNKQFEVIGDVGYNRQLVKYNGKLYTRSHDGRILREDYLQAHKAYVSKPKSQRNNTASGIKNVTYVKDNNGKVWYFDEKTGKAIIKDNYKKVVKQESAFVANQLHKAAKDIGTDNELLEKGVKNIYSADILAGVNEELRTKDKDYDVDVKKTNMMPVEALILDENNHKSARPLLKTLIDSGAMTPAEQARTIKREMEYELAGESGSLLEQGKRALEHFEFGTSYTSTEDLSEIMKMATSREVRLEIENQYKNDPQFANLKPNDGSYVRARIGIDGGWNNWSDKEVDQFDANWVKTGAYQEARYVLQRDENGVEILDKNGQPVYVLDEGDQAHRNSVADRLIFGYNDKEALNKGLDALNDDDNSFDQKHFLESSKKEVNKDPNGKYKSRFTGQDPRQRFLAGFHSDANGNVDSGNVSASNTCLYKGFKPPRVQAEETLYDVKAGDYSKSFNSMDPEAYTEMAAIIKNGDIKDVKNMNDLYKKALNSTQDKLKQQDTKANAMLSGQVKFTDAEITDFCVELMHEIDFSKGMAGNQNVGSSAAINNGYGANKNLADTRTEQLKAILQGNPQVLASVKKKVETGKFEQVSTVTAGLQSESYKKDTKKEYLQMISDTKVIANDEIFLDENGKQITDKAQIAALKQTNMQALNEMRQYVAELERDFKKGVDAEGALSNLGNAALETSGWGTDRVDVANKYRNAKLMLKQFEAAAQGKLRDKDGKVISTKDLAKLTMAKQNELAKTNSDYKESIAYAKMAVVMTPVIVASAGAGTVMGLAGAGTYVTSAVVGTVAGATSYGVNAVEFNTSYTGNTSENREQNLEDSLNNGITTGLGIAQMKYIGNIASTSGKITRTVTRLGATVGADTLTGSAAEALQNGDVSKSGLLSNMVMSGAGNIIGIKSLSENKVKPGTKPVLEHATNNGTSITGGKLNETKFNAALNEAKNVTPDNAAKMYKQADLHQVQNRTQGKAIKNEVLSSQGIESHNKKLTSDTKSGKKVINEINQNTAHTTESILADKNAGALAPHDAATLESNLVNNLNTKEEIELFKQQLKERVGVDGNGKMFKYEVQGKDHAADLMAKADKKLKQLADFDDVLKTIPEQGGMGDLTAVKEFIQKPSSTVEQLQTLLDKMNSNPAMKSFSGTKKLKTEIQNQIDIRKTKAQVKQNAKKIADETPIVNRQAENTPSVNDVKPENIISDVNSINISEIPSQHQPLWKNCQEKIQRLTKEFTVPTGMSTKELIAQGKELLSSIKTIANSATGAIKVKLEGLYNDIKAMLNKSKKQIQNTHINKLSEKQKENVYSLREFYHSDLDDIPTLRMDYPQYNYMSDKELLDFFKLDEKHAAFVRNRKDLFENGNAKYMERAYWNDSPYELTNNHSAWKMHLYSIDELDYQQMADVVLPYLNKHKIAHKTLSSTMSPELLSKTAPEQTGKAFTIYPQSQEEMAQIAKDLDKLIREHKLTTNTSHITGDNQLGDSGRLFYRYEYPTGKLKDKIYSPRENAPYDGNRGEGKYLADDMTPADDPWLNFDPSDPNAQPGKEISAIVFDDIPERFAADVNTKQEYVVWDTEEVALADVKTNNASNMRGYVVKVDGQPIKVEMPAGATKEEIIAKAREKAQRIAAKQPKSIELSAKDAREFNNPTMKRLVGNMKPGLQRSRLLDIDSAIESLPDGDIKTYVNNKLSSVKKYSDFEEIELLINAHNEMNGLSSHYMDLDFKANQNGQVNLTRKLSDNVRLRKMEELDGFASVERMFDADVNKGGLNKAQRRDVFMNDIKQNSQMSSAIEYMCKYPNNEMSEKLYSKYLQNRFTKNPEFATRLGNINKEYGVKIIVPSKYGLKSMYASTDYIEAGLAEFKRASGGQAKLPAIMDFGTAKPMWYSTKGTFGMGIGANAVYMNETKSLGFHNMDEATVKQSFIHEMTHANDLGVAPDAQTKHNFAEIFPKKTIVEYGKMREIPDISKAKYANEFRAAGISERHIEYAHNNTKEFIAVASEGDISKYSDEFKQLLIDLGMPEWRFNMQKF